ncbi:unnamed protein product [Urochloa decumbens]|uniref:Uncharacterized protein n=1 Tax=Urochloa decumbens TaxID=240449 RepID=A0ABC8Z9V9_9POAL
MQLIQLFNSFFCMTMIQLTLTNFNRMLQGESSRAAAVDIDELAGCMLKQIDYHLSVSEVYHRKCGSCVISKIKQHFRVLDKRAYEPIVFSIGPYHHGSPGLQAIERKKWNCLDYILKLNSRSLEDYLSVIVSLEQQVRDSYTEEIKMEDSELFRMLLLDGCFLLVHLCGHNGMATPDACKLLAKSDETSKNSITRQSDMHMESECSVQGYANGSGLTEIELDDVGTNVNNIQNTELYLHDYGQYEDGHWYYSCAAHDLLLLENQIPFFVVKEIYNLFAGQETGTFTLADNISRFLEGLMPYYPKASLLDRPKNIHHLLHLFHMFFRPSQKAENSQYTRKPKWIGDFLPFGQRYSRLSKENMQETPTKRPTSLKSRKKAIRWRRAMHYYEAGIEFKRKELDKENPHSLLDISFRDGVLEIPHLPVDQNTSSLFRNFVALEETCPQFGNDFTAYVAFISQLISAAGDVTMLSKRGIIVHEMRSDEDASALLTKLGKNVDFDLSCTHYLNKVCWMMEEHYQSRLNRWIAWLWHNHLSNPWLAVAVLAGTVVLLCTILQLLFALLAYVNQGVDAN